MTAVISATGTSRTAKRAACIHLLFNVAGAVMFGVLIFAASFAVPQFFNGMLTPVEISIFHTIFNVCCTLALYPFGDLLVKLSGAFVPEKTVAEGAQTAEDKVNIEEQRLRRHLDERILESPAIALAATQSEVVNLGRVVAVNINDACGALESGDEKLIQDVHDREKLIDHMTGLLTNYLIKIDQLSLSERQKFEVTRMLNTLTDMERVGDHAENIVEKAKYIFDNGVHFTEKGIQDLQKIGQQAQASFSLSINALEDNSIDEVIDTKRSEDIVDRMEREMREHHMQRLSEGKCSTSAGVAFLDVIGDLERISDHADNIAGYVKSMLQ